MSKFTSTSENSIHVRINGINYHVEPGGVLDIKDKFDFVISKRKLPFVPYVEPVIEPEEPDVDYGYYGQNPEYSSHLQLEELNKELPEAQLGIPFESIDVGFEDSEENIPGVFLIDPAIQEALKVTKNVITNSKKRPRGRPKKK